ncbi:MULTISPECIES: MIP family channel protein [unclassified Streptomyces]|uniref:MIP/aquaporin family protein n=1 Tax=unclassified Streptomyces TaxID=2593676 RepID=UPI000DB988BA|nr:MULTISPECIES: MIP family channel protein [Streptomyces]MYU07598.1 MIP family channel protein [Streptomyces sp. SID8366]MYU63111.1 MIP family channel protein [Streptomyces sp. SID69]RAJ60307.1 glycerol uptake facilitator protein [Streptomyces sp. PsTaAH-130]TXJ81825.1 MIP family channel protein [Streptomyces lavendulae]
MAVEIPSLIKPSALRARAGLLGECLAEFLGTFVLICFGCGVVAMAVAALPGSGRAATPTTIFLAAGDWLLITWGWAMAVVFGVYVAGGVSGAHINPAVTLAMAVRRGFPWVKVLPYWFAQLVGAFTGAALVYLVYHQAIGAYDAAAPGPKVNGHTNASFSIFATFPAAYFHGGIWGPLIDQIVGTAFLVMFVVAVIDLRNQAVQSNLAPLITGFIVAAIGMSFGANAGYAINPARDFGPRLLTYAEGWGSLAFPGSLAGAFSGYWWIPIVGPLVGGVIGVLVYDLFIGDVLMARLARNEPPEPGRARPEPPR